MLCVTGFQSLIFVYCIELVLEGKVRWNMLYLTFALDFECQECKAVLPKVVVRWGQSLLPGNK